MDENKNKTTGFLFTIGFHALILLLLFVIPGFKLDFPGSPEPIEVELGGGGGMSGSNGGNNDNEISQPAQQTTPQEASTTSDISTDEKGEMTVPKEEKSKKTPVQTTKKPEVKTEKAREAEKGSIYKGKGSDKNKTPGGGGNDDKGPGNTMGDNPDPGYGPSLNKPGLSMKGRSLVGYINFDKNFTDVGDLVFRIVVDRNGNVIDVKSIPPTTITDAQQIYSARQKLLTAKFNAKPDAAEEQVGYYTIHYEKH